MAVATGAAITAIGSIIGAGIGSSGAKDQRRWDARQAELNRQFQRDMSNTAVQRRMADLEAAGINPALAAKWDASSPTGNIPPGSPNVGQAALTGANNAMQVLTQKANLELLGNQAKKVEAETENTQATTLLVEAQTRLANYGADVAQPTAFMMQTAMQMLEQGGIETEEQMAAFLTAQAAKVWQQMRSTGQNMQPYIDTVLSWGAEVFQEWRHGKKPETVRTPGGVKMPKGGHWEQDFQTYNLRRIRYGRKPISHQEWIRRGKPK